jgi:hypothetical protein
LFLIFFSDFVQGRNKALRGFLRGLQATTTESSNAVANAIEAVYFVRNNNFIGPLSFAKSLLVYSKTGM